MYTKMEETFNMTKEELKDMMKGYIQDATQQDVPKLALLDRMMEDIESYANKRVVTGTKSGPYWDRINISPNKQ